VLRNKIESCIHAHVGVELYPGTSQLTSTGDEEYHPEFEAMQDVGTVLNRHGEVPSDTIHLESFHPIRISTQSTGECYETNGNGTPESVGVTVAWAITAVHKCSHCRGFDQIITELFQARPGRASHL
jgi:hypothetical protein